MFDYFNEMTPLLGSLVCVCIFIISADASSYHVTLLGRDTPATGSPVGEIRFKTAGADPTIVSHYNDACTDVSVTGATIKSATFTDAACSNIVPTGTQKAHSGIRLSSGDAFSLHVHQTDTAGTVGDGYLAIPDEHLGDEYYVLTYCTLGGTCQFAITAVEDDTYVSVVFPDPVSQTTSCVSGMPIPSSVQEGTEVPYLINEFETLHFESVHDLSGVYIKASNKVSVVVGARDVPTAADTTSNMIEQIIPVNKWGTEFVVAPNFLNNAGDVIKIVSKVDSTIVRIVGFTPFMIEKAGDYVERRIDWQIHSRIITSNPVMIIQLMSVDLYNVTDDVTGSPAMVLVPHIDQWSSDASYFYCTEQNKRLFALVAESALTITGATPNNDWTEVETTNHMVYIGQSDGDVVEIPSGRAGGYGFCNSNSAFLLAANWESDNTECLPTTATPGDDIDNDCNGQIDEINCTIDDLVSSFTSDQRIPEEDGGIQYKTFAVRGIYKLKMKVQTCDIAMIAFSTNADPMSTFTIAISPDNITTIQCTQASCTPTTVPNLISGDCGGLYEYGIQWGDGNPPQVVNEWINLGAITFSDPPSPTFDEMIVSAFVGQATFEVHLMVKDCGKIYGGVQIPDSYGNAFLIPVTDADNTFSVVLTNPGTAAVNFTIKQTNNVSLTVPASSSFWFEKTNIQEASYQGILLEVNSDELLVHVFRTITSGGAEMSFSLIPLDVAGPSYHTFDSQLVAGSTSCDLFSIGGSTSVDGVGIIPEDDTIQHIPAAPSSELAYRHLLQGSRVMAVFCGSDKVYAQMPPRETLGEIHYIPSMVLLGDVTAQINVIAVEDSTVVVIKGDYDQLDSVTLTGEIYTRTLESDMLYSIEGTKPLQVHLEFIGTDLNAVIVIPPVNQYKEEFITFADASNAEIDDAYVVDENGTMLSLTINPNVRVHPLGAKAFMVVFGTRNTKRFVMTNQQGYADINEVCVITVGTPGDGIDNDCDGLVDEEECTVVVEPGNIDVDIDGEINEDCAPSTTAPDSNVALDVSFNNIQCTSGGGSGAPTGGTGGGTITDGSGVAGSTGITIAGTTPVEEPTVNPPVLNIPVTGIPVLVEHSPPIFSISFATSTVAPGTDTTIPAADPDCTAGQCYCPCSWIEPAKNYTKAEIHFKVQELITKLTISKDTLSANVRKKISASDERPSAVTVGWVAVVWLTAMFGAVIILDISSVIRDCKMLINNIRQMGRG